MFPFDVNISKNVRQNT